MTVHQSPSRSYLTPAAVNGRAFEFIIDTGAASTLISTAMAQQAEVACQRAATFTLASGMVNGCFGRANELAFGPFKLQNVEVAIVAGADKGLLGMDVLRHFNMAWSTDVVRITSLGVAGPIPASVPNRPMATVVPWAGPVSSPLPVQSPASAATAKASLGPYMWFLLAAIVYGFLAMRTKLRSTEIAKFTADLNSLRTGGRDALGNDTSARDRRRLLVACGGDYPKMQRLIEHECRRTPEISEGEAVRRALERIERDRT